MKMSRYLWLVLVIAALDQAVKLVVKLHMLPGESIPVAGDLFRITFVENNGFAFGLTLSDLFFKLGVDLTSESAKLWLSLLSVLALAALFYTLWKFAAHRSPLPWWLAVVIGGALGNVIDRLFYGMWFSEINTYVGGFLHGRVVDMFFLNPAQGLFSAPIFNLADVAISLGVFTLLLFQGRFQRIHRKKTAASLSDDLAGMPGV